MPGLARLPRQVCCEIEQIYVWGASTPVLAGLRRRNACRWRRPLPSRRCWPTRVDFDSYGGGDGGYGDCGALDSLHTRQGLSDVD